MKEEIKALNGAGVNMLPRFLKCPRKGMLVTCMACEGGIPCPWLDECEVYKKWKEERK